MTQDGKPGQESAPPQEPSADRSTTQPTKLARKAEKSGAEEEEELLPAPFKKMIEMGLGFTSGPGHHPIFEKFTEAHIDKFLDYIQRDDDQEYNLQRTNRWFSLAYALIGVSFLVFLVVFLLPSDKDLLREIMKLAASFAGGVGSGFGLKAHLDRKSR